MTAESDIDALVEAAASPPPPEATEAIFWDEAPPPTDADAFEWRIPTTNEPDAVAESLFADVDAGLAELAAGGGTNKPSVLERSDGHHLLYRRAINGFAGEPGSGKTTTTAIATAQVLAAGGTIMFLDFEDVLIRVLERLIDVGASADDLRERFLYREMTGPTSPERVQQFCTVVAELAVDLVVIDGVTDALSAEGLKEESATDFGLWVELLPKPLARAGSAAVILLDHVTKNRKDRELWPRGSGHKLAAIDGVQYMVNAVVPFSREQAGYSDLAIAKDRAGHIGPKKRVAARVFISPLDDGAIAWRIDDPAPGAVASARGIPDELLERAEEAVRRLGGTDVCRQNVSDRLRAEGFTFTNSDLSPALMMLAEDGRLLSRPSGNGFRYSLPGVAEGEERLC